MTIARDYTLTEIDAMRAEVTTRVMREFHGVIPTGMVEDRLRTYLSVGVTLADLRGGVAKEVDPFEDEGK